MSFNLATMLRESRVAKPDHPLCHIRDLTFSGDKVAVQLPNLPQFLFTYFAILKPAWSWCR